MRRAREAGHVAVESGEPGAAATRGDQIAHLLQLRVTRGEPVADGLRVGEFGKQPEPASAAIWVEPLQRLSHEAEPAECVSG